MHNDARQLCLALADVFADQGASGLSTPQWAAVAPGRVNLIGDHTDYSGGLAMPMAVDLFTVAVAAPRSDSDRIRVRSTLGGEPASFSSDAIEQRQFDWADYLRGVYAGYLTCGISIPPIDLLIGGNLPIGAGLSSSASLELCFATLIETIAGKTLSDTDRAALCQHAEHQYAGVPCGILDQAAIVHAQEGHALMLDCRDVTFTQVPVPEDARWAIVDSGVRHDLSDGSYAQRLREVRAVEATLGKSLRDGTLNDLTHIDDSTLRQRARHVISENARVTAFADAISRGDYAAAGDVMYASHESLARDFATSCREMDLLVDLARESGARGARMTGGGFGGSMVCLVEPDAQESLESQIRERYAQQTGKQPTVRWVTPAAGPWAGEWSAL